MTERKLNKKITILLPGVIGATGALLILIADIAYNLFNGSHLGSSLYISTYFGIFLFPLWWGGIWVIYKGLKPAGLLWSLFPCLLFAFTVSTVNVFYHSSYPFWAAIDDMQAISNGAMIQQLEVLKEQINKYIGAIDIMSNLLELIISVWICIPILRGKSLFPRWTALLVPIFPLVGAALVNILIPGFLETVSPYIASSFMLINFIVCTVILYKKEVIPN